MLRRSPNAVRTRAPGLEEPELKRLFAWAAGKTLFRWFASIGLEKNTILAITLTAPPQASQIEISISPKAPTFGEYPLEALWPEPAPG
jgi:hypothetical protein